MKPDCPYVSRGGLKLAGALDAFAIDPTGRVCADFGANVGGFTDCLLARGARRVHAVDTGYGDLAWTLRKDDRVIVHERTNALHALPPEPVDLVVADMSWTTLAHAIPAAAGWLKPANVGVIALLKPIYELAKREKLRGAKSIDDARARRICEDVCGELHADGHRVRAVTVSPIRGKGGNVEFLLWIEPAGVDGDASET